MVLVKVVPLRRPVQGWGSVFCPVCVFWVVGIGWGLAAAEAVVA
jgi:hypothetical protein